MCIGGSPSYAAPATPQRETAAFQDAPPVVTGKQTGVENPKDTKKVTEELKIKRQKKEGTYVEPNPNLQRTEELLTRRGGGNKTAQQKANLAANRKKAKSLALKRKAAKNTRPKGSYGGASDIRLKENIVQIGTSKMGYKIYEFNYKNDDTRYRGAMAQDVITKLPEAIGVRDGYFTVNYDMIDITMEAI